MAITQDQFLTECVGHPVLTVRSPDGLRADAEGRDAAMYQAKVEANDVEQLRRLAGGGLYVVNTGITLGREPEAPEEAGEIEVGDADPERDEGVLEVAATSFRYSRFHLDPAIPEEVANRIKREWAANCLRGERGEQLLVARRDGRAVGFLAVVAGEGTRVIDLIAVSPAEQASGAGRALVTRFLRESAGRCDLVQVGTQAANVSATSFYERLGFRAMASFYDLHMHVGPWAKAAA